MIDWERFAARVPAGTRVVYLNPDETVAVIGILLENYPYKRDDLIASTDNPKTRETLSNNDFLRYQPLAELGDYIFVLGPGARYLIDNRWLTFDQIMA